MKEIKIINETYDENTKITSVTISTPIGNFIGTAKKHDEDDYSSFAGARLAELRAIIKFCEAKLKIVKIKISTLEEIYKKINSQEIITILKQKQSEKRILELNIESLKERIKKNITERDKVLKKIKENKEKK